MDNVHIGIIESIDDPNRVGRCKIRVHGLFGHQSDNIKGYIPTDHLPWAYPNHQLSFGTNGASSYSTPKIGQTVLVKFDGDIYHPLYIGISDLDDGILDIASRDYEGFKAIHIDTENNIRIFYTNGDGLVIENEQSIMTIDNDARIFIAFRDETAAIELTNNRIDIVTNDIITSSSNNQILHNSNFIHVNGVRVDIGGNAIYNAVLFQPMMLLMKQMAAIIDQKLPASPGVTSGIVNQMENLIKSDSIRLTK